MTRGQAALEFLTTYGFAILVVLTAIAALAYFGVLNPSNNLPDKVVMGPEFAYQDHLFRMRNAGPEFLIALSNYLPYPIIVEPTAPLVNCHDCEEDGDVWVPCAYRYDRDINNMGCAAVGYRINPGEVFRIGCQPGTTPANNVVHFNGVGERHTVSIRFEYKKEGDTYPKTYEAMITARVDS